MKTRKIKTWMCRGELGHLCYGNLNPQWCDMHLGEPLGQASRGMYVTALCFGTKSCAKTQAKKWNDIVRRNWEMSEEDKKQTFVHPVKVHITMEEIR